ncbi:MAG TPA: hypothetical protein P5311_01210 [Candidatus Dojkabacteria bacterium]|mgnify:CR=1 FL=1|nr:hypothetical protein [Candidatus Dojkabacteria bacterium]
MEYSNLENGNEYKQEELIFTFVSDISPLVFSNIITDDNRSTKNDLSGLDQVIMLEVGEYMDEVFNLEFVRAGIRIQVALMQKDLENGLISKEDIFNADFYKEIYEEEEEYFDEDDIDDYDDEYWEEYYDYDFDDERFQAKIRRIAVGTLAGRITTDNPSQINGLTGYEQALYYIAHLLPAENEGEREKHLEKIARKVQAYLIDFEGGYDLISMINKY